MMGFTRQDESNEQRYESVKEVVELYLGDEGGDSADLIRDIKRACLEIREYHDDRSKHLNNVADSFNG